MAATGGLGGGGGAAALGGGGGGGVARFISGFGGVGRGGGEDGGASVVVEGPTPFLSCSCVVGVDGVACIPVGFPEVAGAPRLAFSSLRLDLPGPVGVVSLVPGVAPVPVAPDGDVVDGVPSVVPVPGAPDGDDGDVVPNFALGVTPVGAPLLAPVWGSAGPLGPPGRVLLGLRCAVPCGGVPGWVPVAGCVPVPSLVTVPCGGGVVVAEVDVAFAGNTGLVDVFAFVSTSACWGTGAWPELIAAAFICSDFDIGGAAPVWLLAAAATMLLCIAGATLIVLLMIVVLWMLLKIMLFGGGAT
jgi:hypothetical protein